MNIYLIWQNEYNGYDSYESAVVIAKSAARAKQLHPDGSGLIDGSDESFNAWVNNPKDVQVEYIGVASKKLKEGVVCASFIGG